MTRHLVKILYVFIATLIFANTAFAYTSEDAQTEIDKIQEEIDALQIEIDELYAKEGETEEYLLLLAEQIFLTQDSVEIATENIAILESNILLLTEKIADAALEYEDTIYLLKERLVALYTAGTTSTLEILLDSSSLKDFTLRTITLETAAACDKALLQKIEEYALATKEDREELAYEKELIEMYQQALEENVVSLDLLVSKNESLILAIENLIYKNEEELVVLEGELSEFEERLLILIEDEEARVSIYSQELGVGDGSEITEGFDDPAWPLPGYSDLSWVSCEFGENGHQGYDIMAAYGAPIVAAQSGYVVSAEYHFSWGYNVLIYHNDTYTTRYAHMCEMVVSAGDYVEKGQIIGYVGSTGNSTGYHLHFELYVDGVTVDPVPYIR